MYSADPDVERLRIAIGRRIHDAETIQILEPLHAGAILRAGLGGMTYQEVADWSKPPPGGSSDPVMA
jgi:hypothetical protein